MKKIIVSLLIMTFFLITANAQTRPARIRIKEERRLHRMELRRIRKHHRRRFAVEFNTTNSQKLQAVLYKTECDKYRARLV